MAWIGMVGAIVSAAGSVYSAEAQRNAHKYNEQVARQNETQARRQAAADEARQRRFAAKHLGDMRASFAASGVQMEGTPLAVLDAELDALNIRHAGEMRARRFDIEAKQSRMGARSARVQGQVGAGSAMLSGYQSYRSTKAGSLRRT